MRAAIAGACFAALLVGATCKVRVSGSADEVEGDFPCETCDTCPAPDHGCLISTCMEGQCVFIPAPNGVLPAEEQVVGDCKELFCSGDGEVIAYASQYDLPRGEKNPCSNAVCDLDVPKQEPKLAGTHCPLPKGAEGLCNGAGQCGVCLPQAHRCEGRAVATCSAEGTWGSPAACGTGQPVCSRGACIGIVEVDTGANHACARFEDGTVRCWGEPTTGKLGTAGLGAAKDPAWASGFRQVALGRTHQCGTRNDGGVWCWGRGGLGQLGHGAHQSSAGPVHAGIKARAVAVGDQHSCAITMSGTVRCWGRNDFGQLGRGKAPGAPLGVRLSGAVGAQPKPQLIPQLADAKRLILDGATTCVVRDNGDTRCWGPGPPRVFAPPPNPDAGEPTLPPEIVAATKNSPGLVAGVKTASTIGCGAHHCCAGTRDGGVSCWGRGHKGQLGTSDTSNRLAATAVPGIANVKQIGVGRRFACALGSSGTVSCWGDNSAGQLGSGSDKPFDTAHEISTLGSVATLHVGAEHACALLESGKLMCWGSNRAGQLGQSGMAISKQPIEVGWP